MDLLQQQSLLKLEPHQCNMDGVLLFVLQGQQQLLHLLVCDLVVWLQLVDMSEELPGAGGSSCLQPPPPLLALGVLTMASMQLLWILKVPLHQVAMLRVWVRVSDILLSQPVIPLKAVQWRHATNCPPIEVVGIQVHQVVAVLVGIILLHVHVLCLAVPR